ncbi:MAG: hypothetical protein DU489_07065 [Nitrosomonas sp.]|uniref:hypothetical protein n=1 Tax=Nitrosomonas sp. TaxID=42353 RepID=UPI0032EE0792
MIEVKIQIQGLDKLRANFNKAPALALKYLALATKASIDEVEKRNDDSGDSKLFQFKTPRAKRTGQLASSFAHGRHFSPSGLSASIGPTVHYAPYVYFGTRRNRPNKYMDRIAKASEPAVEKQFQKAVNLIVDNLAKK